MAILALDLGGTKLASAVFSASGKFMFTDSVLLDRKQGTEVGAIISAQVARLMKEYPIDSIGVSVPGISRHKAGTVWAPNIAGWEDYPLLAEIKKAAGSIPVSIDSDRACSIFGEQWLGSAKGCTDAIFVAVGTGIGAGILTGGKILRGSNDIGGAIGWMALPKPFDSKYIPCGCFEFYASGAGIPKFALEVLNASDMKSSLREIPANQLTASDIFAAGDRNDELATGILDECIAYWGMAAANLVSIFNPEKIIFGGGIFGPAVKFIDRIKTEATKWGQPISMTQVSFEKSSLGGNAAVVGAGFLAIKNKSVL